MKAEGVRIWEWGSGNGGSGNGDLGMGVWEWGSGNEDGSHACCDVCIATITQSNPAGVPDVLSQVIPGVWLPGEGRCQVEGPPGGLWGNQGGSRSTSWPLFDFCYSLLLLTSLKIDNYRVVQFNRMSAWHNGHNGGEPEDGIHIHNYADIVQHRETLGLNYSTGITC